MTAKWDVGHGIIFMIAAALGGTQGLAQDDRPQTTDGSLQLVDSRFQALYWRPGASLERYRRIVILDCLVQFRDNWLTDENRGKFSSDKVTSEDMTRIGQVVADEFRGIFTEVLQEDGDYEIVDVAAEDVLVLRPAIANLDIGATAFGPGRASPEASSLSMTLYMEFFDSATSTMIGRVVDARSRPDSNRAAVRQVVSRWARNVRATLEDGTVDW
jgi:hypothetical protein